MQLTVQVVLLANYFRAIDKMWECKDMDVCEVKGLGQKLA